MSESLSVGGLAFAFHAREHSGLELRFGAMSELVPDHSPRRLPANARGRVGLSSI